MDATSGTPKYITLPKEENPTTEHLFKITHPHLIPPNTTELLVRVTDGGNTIELPTGEIIGHFIASTPLPT